MAEKSVYSLRTRLVAYPCFFVLAVWQLIQSRRQRGEVDEF
jgi:cytochrome oxidase assembly protein ShyY1